MKTRKWVLAAMALAAAIGFSTTGCPMDSNGDYVSNGPTLPALPTGHTVLAQGETFLEQLGWVRSNFINNHWHLIEIGADAEEIEPQELNFGGAIVGIILRGRGEARAVRLRESGSLFSVGPGVALRLGDNITLRGIDENDAPLVTVEAYGILIMEAGSKVAGNTRLSDSPDAGGGITVFGAFAMYGGTITGNSIAADTVWVGGGGVHVGPGGKFTMRGGTISHNSTSSGYWNAGGGVSIGDGAVFAMYNGAISHNNSREGAGVRVGANGTFVMRNGTISHNTSAVPLNDVTGTNFASGGGVMVSGSGTFTMHNGAISNNGAISGGGVIVGIFGGIAGVFTMHGGAISDNTAGFGGGVTVWGNLHAGAHIGGIFDMRGGTISGNAGDGVHSQGNFRISHGVVQSVISSNNGTAQFGTDELGWQDLPAAQRVIEVINGVLQGGAIIALNLSGQVWMEDLAWSCDVCRHPGENRGCPECEWGGGLVEYAGPDLALTSHIGGEGAVAGGQLSFAIGMPVPLGCLLEALGYLGVNDYWDGVEVGPAGARGALLMHLDSGPFQLERRFEESDAAAGAEAVDVTMSIFAEQAVTISGAGRTDPSVCYCLLWYGYCGCPERDDRCYCEEGTLTTQNFSISLLPGWNDVHFAMQGLLAGGGAWHDTFDLRPSYSARAVWTVIEVGWHCGCGDCQSLGRCGGCLHGGFVCGDSGCHCAAAGGRAARSATCGPRAAPFRAPHSRLRALRQR